MFSMIRYVMNVPVFTAVESLLHSSAPMSRVSSTTVSLVGLESIRLLVASSTSHWSRKEPTGHAQSPSDGVRPTQLVSTCVALHSLIHQYFHFLFVNFWVFKFGFLVFYILLINIIHIVVIEKFNNILFLYVEINLFMVDLNCQTLLLCCAVAGVM